MRFSSNILSFFILFNFFDAKIRISEREICGLPQYFSLRVQKILEFILKKVIYGKFMGIHVQKENFHFLVSTLNHLGRILAGGAPYTTAYREGDEQDDGKEDADIYPPGDGCLLHVLHYPLLHDDIAYGEGDGRGGKNDESVLLYKYGEDIAQCSAMYLAQGNFLATLRTGKRHDRVHTEYSYEDAH